MIATLSTGDVAMLPSVLGRRGYYRTWPKCLKTLYFIDFGDLATSEMKCAVLVTTLHLETSADRKARRILAIDGKEYGGSSKNQTDHFQIFCFYSTTKDSLKAKNYLLTKVFESRQSKSTLGPHLRCRTQSSNLHVLECATHWTQSSTTVHVCPDRGLQVLENTF